MFELQPLPIVDAYQLDGLKLTPAGGGPILLYSAQSSVAHGQYEMVISAASVADAASSSEVATLTRLLPVPPSWDARLDDNGNYEFVFEFAGGALNSITFRDGHGEVYTLNSAHPFESFTHPHFVRGDPGMAVPDIGATADNKKVVVFPQFARNGDGQYAELVDGEDGIATGSGDRLVVSKKPLSGPSFNVPPGQLFLTRLAAGTTHGLQVAASTPFPDLIVYEFDAASGRGDVVVFATAKPAVMVLGSRPARPIQFAAPDRRWLSALSRPTILLSDTHVHAAAIANRGTERAVVLYGALAIDSVFAP